jgi:hypothetical protein
VRGGGLDVAGHFSTDFRGNSGAAVARALGRDIRPPTEAPGECRALACPGVALGSRHLLLVADMAGR